ncbi:hypothetical protein Ahy_B10g101127 [Arachis hypogaea]|uniref:Zinc finger PMZ-type domain-containing protein n=1 Tax=Arachis hypogaea TaxID=3818 RepID=A0A444WYJ7_ARAHY|nr:hypothetical protein Ahy_B10g101127 [Arachis hypogaea]
MGRGKYKSKPTGRRQFSTPEDLLAGTSNRPRTFRQKEAEHEEEPKEVSEDESGEESEEEEATKSKGTQGIIEIENPNLVKPKSLKARDVDVGKTTELSRQRLALIRQQRAEAAKKREEEKAGTQNPLPATETASLRWHDVTAIEFEDGLHVLYGKEINNMCDFTMSHNMKEFHLYFEHGVDIPVVTDDESVVEEVVSEDDDVLVVIDSSKSSSSSYDSYESAEDEAYKPPPPGYETESSEESVDVQRKKKKNEKFGSPKTMAKRRASKGYTGKRRMKHILNREMESGSSSGDSGLGQGPGSGGCVGPDLGVPCVHAIAAISRVRVKSAIDFVSPFLTMETIRKTYDICINHVLSEEYWEPTNQLKADPPKIVRPVGRPTKRRKESATPPAPSDGNKGGTSGHTHNKPMHQRPNPTLEEIRAKIKKHKKKMPKRPHAPQEEIPITQSAPPVQSQGEPTTPGQPTPSPPGQSSPAPPAQPSARFRPKLKTFRPPGSLNPQIGHQPAATPENLEAISKETVAASSGETSSDLLKFIPTPNFRPLKQT